MDGTIMITVTVRIHETEFDLEVRILSIQLAEPGVGIMSSYVDDYTFHWADGTQIPNNVEELIIRGGLDVQDDIIRDKLNNYIHDEYMGE